MWRSVLLLLVIGHEALALSTLSRSSSSVPTRLPSAESSQQPFVIDSVMGPKDPLFAEISSVCIQAFFNDNNKDSGSILSTPTTPWKGMQLAYLRALQQADLRERRQKYPQTNFMLVARRVHTLKSSAQRVPLILDNTQIHNLESNNNEEEDYVRGSVIGFVEVTKKPFGNGPPRPVLTNLSVCQSARKQGVGSRLLEACEERVRQQFQANEIVLEVEDDNIQARAFYQKRGFQLWYTDPSSRRYDTTGFWLRQLRCQRQILRKSIHAPTTSPQDFIARILSNNFISL